ncbi:unknown [Prevotella sp. CAG:1185]|nr:unknown [Prevotella sp. CAG:1185]
MHTRILYFCIRLIANYLFIAHRFVIFSINILAFIVMLAV